MGVGGRNIRVGLGRSKVRLGSASARGRWVSVGGIRRSVLEEEGQSSEDLGGPSSSHRMRRRLGAAIRQELGYEKDFGGGRGAANRRGCRYGSYRRR